MLADKTLSEASKEEDVNICALFSIDFSSLLVGLLGNIYEQQHDI